MLPSFITPFLSRYDVVINTTGIYTPLFFRSLLKRYILYVYNPILPLAEFNNAKEGKYQKNLFWRLYFLPYATAIRKSLASLDKVTLIAVSRFTQERIWRYWHKNSTVVYPPVDINKFSAVRDNKKRDGVISIGRFTPEKNHEWQLEIAKQLPDTPFRICGSAKTPYYQRWYRHIKAKAEEMDLKNVEFYPNVSFEKLVELIGESKYFIHTMVNEDFGLTPCEAISGGVLPIVHNSGGPKEIVPFRELRFNDINEAVKILKQKPDPQKYLPFLYTHIQQYDETKFQQRMLEVIRNAA